MFYASLQHLLARLVLSDLSVTTHACVAHIKMHVPTTEMHVSHEELLPHLQRYTRLLQSLSNTGMLREPC